MCTIDELAPKAGIPLVGLFASIPLNTAQENTKIMLNAILRINAKICAFLTRI